MSAFAERTAALNMDELVTRYYEDVWRFAMSLAGNSTDASDLTQQTFYLLQTRGHQIRDARKTKAWLFSTLYHEYLRRHRHQRKFPKLELSQVENELPHVTPDDLQRMDAATVFARMQSLEDKLRIPLSLFYMEEMSYKEIAEFLNVPVGTVMSRLFRAKLLLRGLLGVKSETEQRSEGMNEQFNRQRTGDESAAATHFTSAVALDYESAVEERKTFCPMLVGAILTLAVALRTLAAEFDIP